MTLKRLVSKNPVITCFHVILKRKMLNKKTCLDIDGELNLENKVLDEELLKNVMALIIG